MYVFIMCCIQIYRMIANGGSKAGVGTTSRRQTSSQTILSRIKSLPSRVRLVHVVVAIGVTAVFLGYISVAPPTDLPNWPLYRLNSRVWQTFEHWGQHVKPHHVRIMTMALQHIESRALYILSYFEIPDIIQSAGEPLSCQEIKSEVDKKFGFDPINLPFLCRVLHAAAHFDLLQEAAEGRYGLTPLGEYLVTSHPKSLKEFVKVTVCYQTLETLFSVLLCALICTPNGPEVSIHSRVVSMYIQKVSLCPHCKSGAWDTQRCPV